MTSGSGGEDWVLPSGEQGTALARPWSRAAQLQMSGWCWLERTEHRNSLHQCFINLWWTLNLIELGKGESYANFSSENFSKKWMMVQLVGLSWRAVKWMESHIIRACISKENHLLKPNGRYVSWKCAEPIHCLSCTAYWCAVTF